MTVDPSVSYPSRNELIELRTKVDNQDHEDLNKGVGPQKDVWVGARNGRHVACEIPMNMLETAPNVK